MPAARPLRPAQLQRRHRDERLLGNRDVLDYLLSIGVERIQCLMVYGKASEALLLKYGPEEVRSAPLQHLHLHLRGGARAPAVKGCTLHTVGGWQCFRPRRA